MSSSDPIPSQAPHRDLSAAEFNELDELLDQTPQPLHPCDAVTLDGYLCGILVQPTVVPQEAWLTHVFDAQGRPLPEDVAPAWRERVVQLATRRHAALRRSIEESGWFEPLIAASEDNKAELPDIAVALEPWAIGFEHATMAAFPALVELDDDAVRLALPRILRHITPESSSERAMVDDLNREAPLATLDDAIDDLVQAVVEIYDLTHRARYRVETVRREEPKLGRNDPCHCGSGKKYKQCHGR